MCELVLHNVMYVYDLHVTALDGVQFVQFFSCVVIMYVCEFGRLLGVCVLACVICRLFGSTGVAIFLCL